jgi:catalase
MDEDDAQKFGFDLLDPTKIVPEELVPVTKLGKMQLNLNPQNYFAETEQVMVSRLRPHKSNVSVSVLLMN